MKRKHSKYARIADVLILLFAVVVLSAGVHFWTAERLKVLRAIFPLEAWLHQANLQCSEGAPSWMPIALKKTIRLSTSPANQLAYLDPDGNLHHCENGWRGAPLRSERVTPATRFRFASLTKVVTADAILALADEGKFRLDSKLVDLIGPFPSLEDPRVAEITIEHLLRHSAGFDRLQSTDPMFRHFKQPWCPHDMGQLATIQLDFDPGERQRYSNRGYCLLGQVIEQVVARDYRDHIQLTYELDKLGMAFIDGPYLDDEVRYDFRNSDFYTEEYSRYFDFDALSSVSGLSGNASELASLVGNMLRRENYNILAAKPLERCLIEYPQSCFGYSLYAYAPEPNFKVHIHEGWFPGASPLLMVDDRRGIVVLLTSGNPLEKEKRKELFDTFYRALQRFYDSR